MGVGQEQHIGTALSQPGKGQGFGRGLGKCRLIGGCGAFDDQRGLELAKKIYPRLEAITQIALAFNDHCDNGDCRESKSLHAELEQLGQLLQERFELEDCLIEVLHTAHQQSSVQRA